MARRRMIDPKIWGDATIGRLSAIERLFYIGLISLADDSGKMNANPAFLRAQIMPYEDIPTQQVSQWLIHLQKLKLIHIYKDPKNKGEKYLDHPKWLKYQRIDHPQPSLLPTCPYLKYHWGHSQIESENDSKNLLGENQSKNDSPVVKVSLKEDKLKEFKGKTASFLSPDNQNQRQTQNPPFCPACKKPMADSFDHWVCTECGIKYVKKETKSDKRT